MILIGQDGDILHLGYGNPRPSFDKKHINLVIMDFFAKALPGGEYAPLKVDSNGNLIADVVDNIPIQNNQKIDSVTLQLTESESGIPAYDFFTSRTVGDVYSAEQIEAMSTAEIRAISRYDMDAQDVENFILANGYLSGVRV